MVGRNGRPPAVLIVDLNNFARYPSVAIGYLVAVLRQADVGVEVMAPLSRGVTGVVREPRPPWWGVVDQQLRYRTAVSTSAFVRRVRAKLTERHAPALMREARVIADQVAARINDVDKPLDAVLVSTYLMYHPHCVRIGEICRARGIPLIIGGPYFSQREVAREWMDVPGLSALIGGEVEPHLPEIVKAAADGESMTGYRGVWSMNGQLAIDAPPLQDLDAVPFPDYTDFPWSRYPNRIVPIITGRGCGWGACTFCADIASTAGRTFRSRSSENVLAEIELQARRYDARLFVFTDLKLNSNLDVWHALLDRFQDVAPGAQWIASVHVGANGEHGLEPDELRRARAAGMVRVTTGLESGSQQMLDRMCKGADLSETSRVLRGASDAGISVRTTMIMGYPGEEADDIDRTTAFLRDHDGCIERIVLNRFQIMSGTRFHRHLEASPERVPQVTQLTVNHRVAHIEHHFRPSADRTYRRAVSRLIRAAHEVNRRPLRGTAAAFEGVM